MVKLLLLPVVLVFFPGCTAMQEAALSLDSPSERGPRCSSEDGTKQWDLGTGRALAIRRTAPDFMALRPEGWAMPTQAFEAERAAREVNSFNYKNHYRLKALVINVDGVQQQRTQVDDIQTFDLVTKEIVPYRIRAFTVDDKTAILVTPGTCLHVFATDACNDGKFRTDITTQGTLKCIGPYTAPQYVVIRSGKEQRKAEFGKPLLVPRESSSIRSSSLSFSMFTPDGKTPMGNVEREINDFSDSVPDEVVAVLGLESERPAIALYENLPENLRAKAETKIAKARMAVVQAAGDDPEAVLKLSWGRVLNAGLPGDDDIAPLIKNKLLAATKRVSATASPEKFMLVYKLLAAIRTYGGTKEEIQETGVESKFGPWFADGTIADEKSRRGFAFLFPESKSTQAAQELAQKKAEKAGAEEEARHRVQVMESEFDGLAETMRQIVTMRQQAQVAARNSAMMRNQRRGLAAVSAVRGEADRLQREDFCTAKRDFTKKYGAKEFQDRAKNHCGEQPPTATAEFGREVVLDKECRAVFASGC